MKLSSVDSADLKKYVSLRCLVARHCRSTMICFRWSTEGKQEGRAILVNGRISCPLTEPDPANIVRRLLALQSVDSPMLQHMTRPLRLRHRSYPKKLFCNGIRPEAAFDGWCRLSHPLGPLRTDPLRRSPISRMVGRVAQPLARRRGSARAATHRTHRMEPASQLGQTPISVTRLELECRASAYLRTASVSSQRHVGKVE